LKESVYIKVIFKEKKTLIAPFIVIDPFGPIKSSFNK